MRQLMTPMIVGLVLLAMLSGPAPRVSASDATPTADANKEIVRQYYAAVNAQDLTALDAVLAADIVDHNPFPGQPAGREGLKQTVAGILTAFPDWQVTSAALIAEGDLVVAQNTVRGTHEGTFLGIPATGQPVEFAAIEIWRVEDGMLVETWRVVDLLGLLIQVGAVPPPGGPPPAATPTTE